MKARSLIFDLFGDYLRYHGGSVELRALSELMRCFDVPQATVRVVVGRMRREGWFAASRDGRTARYALTDAAWKLLDQGRARIFERAFGRWDRHWHMVVYSVPEPERAVRDRLRKRLSWLGFGPLDASVWLSPHDRTGQLLDEFGEEPSVQLDVFRSRSAGAAADRGLAARCWDLAQLASDYTAFERRYRDRLPAYRAGQVCGREALIERMHLVHDYRMFPFRDPDLPPELAPAHWPGPAAHELFQQAHRLLRVPAETYVSRIVHGDIR